MTSAATVLMVSQPTVAGVAQCVQDWSEGLRDCGWNVEAACPDDGWLASSLSAQGFTVHPWDAQRSPTAGIRAESATLSAVMDRVKPDIVFAHSSKAGLVARLVTRGRRALVFAPHSWSFEAVHGPTAAAAMRWERFAARWTDRFICVSEAERDLGVKARIRGRYVVARNGIDLTDLTPPADRPGVRHTLGITDDTQAVVCVGRVSEQKGQDVLLQAWPAIRGPQRTLTLVGDGPDLERLRAATSDPQVRFVGGVTRSDALRWMAGADLVVMPSRWEGMALVPLESLALGTPVVATEVNGAREAITDEVGALCPPDDPAALAMSVRRWLDQKPEDQAVARVAARRRVEAHFDIRETVEILDRALRDVVRTPS